jgi:hypothetical protein
MKRSPEFKHFHAKLKAIERSLDAITQPTRILHRDVAPLPSTRNPKGSVFKTRFLDNIGKVMGKKLRDTGMDCPTVDKFDPERKVKRKRLSKLSKIMKLEHEFSGEENWG